MANKTKDDVTKRWTKIHPDHAEFITNAFNQLDQQARSFQVHQHKLMEAERDSKRHESEQLLLEFKRHFFREMKEYLDARAS